MTSPASSEPGQADGPAAGHDASWGAPAVGGDPRQGETGPAWAGAAAGPDGNRCAPVVGDDPRQANTDAVRALLGQAGAMTAGAVRLPAMTAAELCVLGAMTTSLIDASAWSWWTSAPPGRRPVLRETAWRFLAYRQLITHDVPGEATPGQARRVRVSPTAALIVAGRTRPAFIVLCRETAAGEPERTRMYGIADQRGLRAVLIEDATPGRSAGRGQLMNSGWPVPLRPAVRWSAGPPGPAGPGPAAPAAADRPVPARRRGTAARGAGSRSGPPGTTGRYNVIPACYRPVTR